MTIKPLADRVLILPAPAEEKLSAVSSFLIQQKKNHYRVK